MRTGNMLRISRGVALGLTLVMLLAISFACKPKPKEPVQVSEVKGRLVFGTEMPVGEGGDVFSPDLAIDSQGTPHIVYLKQFETIHRVYYVYQQNSGDEFSHEIQLSQKEGQKSMGVTLDSIGDGLYALWTNDDGVGRKLKYRESTDGGRNFTMEEQLNGKREPTKWALTGTQPTPLTFYTITSDNDTGLILNKDFDPDQEFDILPVGNHVREVRAVTGENGDIYVMCLIRETVSGGGGFELLHSTDNAATFKPYRIFPSSLIPVYKNAFGFAATKDDNGEHLHLIWTERAKEGVRLMHSRTSKETPDFWEPPEEMASASIAENWICSQPLLASDGGKRMIMVYAYLIEGAGATEDAGSINEGGSAQDEGGDKVYRMVYRFSEDGGITFQDEALVTEDISSPEIITGGIGPGGTIHIAWDDEDRHNLGARHIYYVSGRMR